MNIIDNTEHLQQHFELLVVKTNNTANKAAFILAS